MGILEDKFCFLKMESLEKGGFVATQQKIPSRVGGHDSAGVCGKRKSI